MHSPDLQTLNLSRPEEIAYWSRVLDVSPAQLMQAIKATGSNLVDRMIWFLKAEGSLPHYFDHGRLTC